MGPCPEARELGGQHSAHPGSYTRDLVSRHIACFIYLRNCSFSKTFSQAMDMKSTFAVRSMRGAGKCFDSEGGSFLSRNHSLGGGRGGEKAAGLGSR